MSFQCEEGHLRPIEKVPMQVGLRGHTGVARHEPEPNARTISLGPLPPFSDLVEINCQDCGGKGYDPGSLNPQELEECPACHGSGKETILRNYLAEAFRIAADPETDVRLERAHLVALTAYARQTVSALLSLPEVA